VDKLFNLTQFVCYTIKVRDFVEFVDLLPMVIGSGKREVQGSIRRARSDK